MPQVVQEYLDTGETLITDIVKKNISDAYIADMARYSWKSETIRILTIYKSIPAQLAKENHKFQYKVIKSGARVAGYKSHTGFLKRISGMKIISEALRSACCSVSGKADGLTKR